MALKPPTEVPQGAMRFNSDSQKLEFYAQDRWHEMATEESSPIAGRGIQFGAGANPRQEIQYFSLVTMGDALNFGDLASGEAEPSKTWFSHRSGAFF